MIIVTLYRPWKWKQSLSLGQKVIKSFKNSCFLLHVKVFALPFSSQACMEIASYLFHNQILLGKELSFPHCLLNYTVQLGAEVS